MRKLLFLGELSQLCATEIKCLLLVLFLVSCLYPSFDGCDIIIIIFFFFFFRALMTFFFFFLLKYR